MWKSQPPRTRVGLALRNLLYGALTSRRLRGVFEWLIRKSASSIGVPAYNL